MTASARRNSDHAIRAGLDGFLGMPRRNHIVQHQAAVTVNRINDIAHGTK